MSKETVMAKITFDGREQEYVQSFDWKSLSNEIINDNTYNIKILNKPGVSFNFILLRSFISSPVFFPGYP